MSVDSKTAADAAADAVRLTETRNRARIGTLLSLTLVALLGLMWIMLAFSTQNFATPNNIQNLLRQGAMTAILAIGETFVIITAGIDLSVGAVVGFTSVIIAILLTNGFPIWAAILITLLFGFAIGAFHAFGISKLGLPPFIMTLATLTALRGITLNIAEGEVLFVTGPNGAGKSTLLNAVAGVVPPVSGTITMDGAAVTGTPPEQIARRGFSLVPEGRNVFGALTIEENLKVGAGMRADKHRVAGDLESVYREFPMLAERRHAPAGMLSGGQQQMLVIGRALMTSPRLIAIDEPSLGLAPKIIDQVYEILVRLRAQRKLTLLIVEQSSTRALMTGGRMVLMRGGRIVLEGAAGDMVKDERLKQAYFGFGDH